MKIQKNKQSPKTFTPQTFTPSFKGPLDSAVTQALIAIDTNPMVNAALVDVFSMVIPRTFVDTKKRNKYAGAETLFRELTGTFIVCLSSGYLAKGISHLYNRLIEPQTKVNPNSWVSNDSLNLLNHVWEKSSNDSKKFFSTVLDGIYGIDGRKTVNFRDIDAQEKEKINQDLNNLFEGNLSKKEVEKSLKAVESKITNVFGVGNSVSVEFDGKKLSTSLHNLLRDSLDLGKNVFLNSGVSTKKALEKLTKTNKVKSLGALALASTLGLTNQYINRQITKKRTGTDAFVGDINYKNKIDNKNNNKQNKAGLLGLKLLTSAGIIGLAAGVMKIKNPKDFIKKLEFTSAITSGNAIKTVYTATLVGRFLAAKDKTELRESATRDYLGFLNWLVFGGFAAKGVANLLDRGQNNLFNHHKTGKGIKHWLNDISLKSHAEIASKGEVFAKKNIWKLNVAHISGLAYSTIALGVLIPLLNIAITKGRHKKSLVIAEDGKE